MRRLIWLMAVVLASLIVAGCSSQDKVNNPEPAEIQTPTEVDFEKAVVGQVGDTLDNGFYRVFLADFFWEGWIDISGVEHYKRIYVSAEVENIGNKDRVTYIGPFNFWVMDSQGYLYLYDRDEYWYPGNSSIGQLLLHGSKMTIWRMNFDDIPQTDVRILFQAYEKVELVPVTTSRSDAHDVVYFYPSGGPIGPPILFEVPPPPESE